MIGNLLAHRCLLDDGNSVDILYLDVLEKMRISPQSLRAAVSLLHGFTGDSIFLEESIELAVSISNFMVVKGRSSYNVIVGRPTLVAMMAVTSIYHICLKFPIPYGVGVDGGINMKLGCVAQRASDQLP